jgi:hypothetical protein
MFLFSFEAEGREGLCEVEVCVGMFEAIALAAADVLEYSCYLIARVETELSGFVS